MSTHTRPKLTPLKIFMHWGYRDPDRDPRYPMSCVFTLVSVLLAIIRSSQGMSVIYSVIYVVGYNTGTEAIPFEITFTYVWLQK